MAEEDVARVAMVVSSANDVTLPIIHTKLKHTLLHVHANSGGAQLE